jgi:hypothetical protein
VEDFVLPSPKYPLPASLRGEGRASVTPLQAVVAVSTALLWPADIAELTPPDDGGTAVLIGGRAGCGVGMGTVSRTVPGFVVAGGAVVSGTFISGGLRDANTVSAMSDVTRGRRVVSKTRQTGKEVG